MSDFNPVPVQSESHPYQKLGGWLKFNVVMAFLGVLFGVFSELTTLKEWPFYEGAELWVHLARWLCLVYIWTLAVLWAAMAIRHDPRFVRTWQLVYIGSVVNWAIHVTQRTLYGFPEDVSVAIGTASIVFSALSILLGLSLWTLYYTKSVRVRTYMGSDEYLRVAFFTKKVKGPAPAVPD